MTTGHAAGRASNRAALMLGGSAGAILCVAAAILFLAAPQQAEPPDRIGGPFTLTADDGSRVTDRSFPGKYLAVYFGYTHCQDVCPATLNNLTGALARLPAISAQIQPLFITIDPSRDTPGVLHAYVKAFSPTLIGLTGPDAAVRQVAESYRVVSVAHGSAIDHSSVIYFMAPDGKFLAPVPADASVMVLKQAMSRVVR